MQFYYSKAVFFFTDSYYSITPLKDMNMNIGEAIAKAMPNRLEIFALVLGLVTCKA